MNVFFSNVACSGAERDFFNEKFARREDEQPLGGAQRFGPVFGAASP
jgi:hypothetical protein